MEDERRFCPPAGVSLVVLQWEAIPERDEHGHASHRSEKTTATHTHTQSQEDICMSIFILIYIILINTNAHILNLINVLGADYVTEIHLQPKRKTM